MNRYRLPLKRCAAVVKQFMFFTFIVTAFATIAPTNSRADGEESIDVTCYKKEDEAGLQIGNVSVTRPETAAVNCNATYYDCKDKCIGCLYDPKLGQTVCYNAAGEKVPQ
jgi:hypothetical protein